jgi:hypothetical protein
MPITYQLKPDERLVVFIHVGVVTDEEFLSFYKALYEENRFDKSFNALVDLRQTESTVRSAEALTEFAEFIHEQYTNITSRPKVAVVAPEDISFGLARMYEVFSGDVPWEFLVFREVDSALAWLGVSENLMDDLDQSAPPEYSPDPE